MVTLRAASPMLVQDEDLPPLEPEEMGEVKANHPRSKRPAVMLNVDVPRFLYFAQPQPFH